MGPQLDTADADCEPPTWTEFEWLDDLLDGGVQRDDGAVVEAQPHVVHPLPITRGVIDALDLIDWDTLDLVAAARDLPGETDIGT